jgi:hypothetical protein
MRIDMKIRIDISVQKLNKIAVAFLVLAVLGGRPVVAAETPAKAVNVTVLPQVEREIVAVAGASGYVLRLTANGEVTRLADLEGNVLLETVQQTPAVTVFEAAGGAAVAATPTDPVTVEQISPAEVKVAVTRGNGVKLTYLAQPERLKVAVEGPAGRYLVRGSYPCRMEGTRVLAPGGVVFAAAGIGTVPGAEQSVIDASRTRALTINREGGDGLRWTMRQVDTWAGAEHLVWETDLAAGQTLQLSATAVPPLTGPVRFGLFSRALFRPTGSPLAVVELDTANWIRGQPRQLKLPKPLGEIVPRGRLLAALLPDGKEVTWAQQDYPREREIRKGHSLPIPMESGKKVPIRIEYRAVAMDPKSPKPDPSFHLNWESLSQPVEHVPTAALSPP